jgi:hypothetical protein
MGWPLAVSAGMMEKSPPALLSALWALAAGHLLAMLLMILPFSLLVTLVYWQRQIRISASLLVIGFAIRERWRGYDPHNSGFGLLRWRSRTARD